MGIDLTNEVQHVETHEVSVERAEEKSAVDHQDPVWSFNINIIIHIHAKSGLRAVLARRSSYAHEVNAKGLIGSHDSDSQLGTTRVVSGARM